MEAKKSKPKRTLSRVRIRPYPRGLGPYSRVEARPGNIDELFYGGVLICKDPPTTTPCEPTFSVLYDDGEIESGLKRSSIICNSRRRISEGKEVLIDDGTILVHGHLRRVRLLHFRSSVGIYQSGLLMSSNKLNVPDLSVLPFEVNQAMALGPLVYQYTHKGSNPETCCFAGLGGGAVPSFLFDFFESKCSIDAIDFSHDVVDAARKHFFLDPKIKVHVADAYSFFMKSELQYDMVMLDVADPSDRFLPPVDFLSDEFISHLARSHIKLVVMNVLPSIKRSRHAHNAASSFANCFKWSCYAYIDPNYVFFGTHCDSSILCEPGEVLGALKRNPRLAYAVPGILRELNIRGSVFWGRTSRFGIDFAKRLISEDFS